MILFVMFIAVIAGLFAYFMKDVWVAVWTIIIAIVYAGIQYFAAGSIATTMAGAKEIEFASDCCFRNAIDVITDRARISVPFEQPLIQDREHMRLLEEAEHLRTQAEQLRDLLHNAGFCAKAPEAVVRAKREQRSVVREKLLRIVTALGSR